jgi:hypothetical protein
VASVFVRVGVSVHRLHCALLWRVGGKRGKKEKIIKRKKFSKNIEV